MKEIKSVRSICRILLQRPLERINTNFSATIFYRSHSSYNQHSNYALQYIEYVFKLNFHQSDVLSYPNMPITILFLLLKQRITTVVIQR